MKKILIISLILILVSSVLLSTTLQGAKITTFADEATEKTITFTGPGWDKSNLKLSIPNNSTVNTAVMTIQGLPDASGNYPETVILDVGIDKKSDWRWVGQGFGAMGKQYLFKDNRVEKDLLFSGTGLEKIEYVRLPKNASVNSASIDLTQYSVPNYGFKIAGTSGPDSTVSGYMYSSDYSTTSYKPKLSVNYGSGSTYTANSAGTIDDAFVTDYVTTYKSYNWGAYTYLTYYQKSFGYIKFPGLSGISPGTPINSATMQLRTYYLAVSGDLYLVTSSWNEGTKSGSTGSSGEITWNNQPSCSDVLVGSFTATSYSTVTIDVAEIVQQWVGCTPSNVGVDIGDTGSSDWSNPGTMTGAHSTTDLSTAFNSYLSTAAPTFVDSYGNEFVDVPISVSTATPGAIKLNDIDIEYDYVAQVYKTSQGSLKGTLNGLVPDGYGAPESGDCTVSINVTSSSKGKVKVSGIDIDYTPPNYRPTTTNIPDAVIDEDTPDETLVDLSTFFFDDKDNPADMKYLVQKNNQDDFLDVGINDDGYHLSVVPTDDWNGEARVQVSATDSGGKDVFSNYFNITVNPVNDEPTVEEEMDQFSLDEGYTQIMMELSRTAPEYFADIDSGEFYYWVQVDPDNKVTDEQLTGSILTKVADEDNYYLQLKASGDWNTEGKDAVPVRLICDDDDQLDDVPATFIDIDVSVFPVNDAPVWKAIEDVTMDEDTVLEDYLDLTDLVTDIESSVEEMSFKIYSNKNKSKIGVSISKDNMLSITPKENYDGSTEVTLEVDDGDNKTLTSFNIFVNGINDKPTVNLLSPNDGTTINEAISVMGNADDIERTLEKVEVKVDGGAWVKAEGIYIWTYELDPLTVSKGDHTLSIRSYDGEDYSEEIGIHFTVEIGGTPGNDLPTVTIQAPKNGDGPLSGTQEIKGKAVDPDGSVAKVELTIDGATFQAEGTSSWSFQWNTPTTKRDGENVTISVKAVDDKGDAGPASKITVLVKNSDSDGDKMPDWYEDEYPDLDSRMDDAMCDPDEDGYINFEEFQAGTDPMDKEDHPGESIVSEPTGDMSWIFYVFAAVLVVIVLVIMVVIILMVMTNIKKKKAEEEQEDSELIPVLTPMGDQPQPIPMDSPQPIPMDGQPQALPQQPYQQLPPAQQPQYPPQQ